MTLWWESQLLNCQVAFWASAAASGHVRQGGTRQSTFGAWPTQRSERELARQSPQEDHCRPSPREKKGKRPETLEMARFHKTFPEPLPAERP